MKFHRFSDQFTRGGLWVIETESFIKLWKFCIFVTEDKMQAIILAMLYADYLHVFDSKSDLEFLILGFNI